MLDVRSELGSTIHIFTSIRLRVTATQYFFTTLAIDLATEIKHTHVRRSKAVCEKGNLDIPLKNSNRRLSFSLSNRYEQKAGVGEPNQNNAESPVSLGDD